MMIATVGTIISIATENFASPNVVFLSGLFVIFITSAVLHPQEMYCLIHGAIYFLVVSTSLKYMMARFELKVGQISPKSDKSENFQIRCQDILAQAILNNIYLSLFNSEMVVHIQKNHITFLS